MTRSRIVTALVMAVAVTLGGTAGAQADTTVYDALGDSFSTGQGLPGTLAPPCLPNPTAAYSAKVAQQLGASLSLVACSGATTTSIMATQLDTLDADTDLVTLTAGGNDVGVFDFIRLCVDADCSDPLVVRQFLTRIITEVPGQQTALYQAIAARVGPDAKVRVLGYPLLITLRPTGGSDPVCPAFSPQERLVGGLVAATFDAVTRGAVSSLGDSRFRYVSALRPPFLGHELCGTQEPAFMGGAGPVPLHPNDLGHQDYAKLVLGSV